MSKYVNGIRIGEIISVVPEKHKFLNNDNCVIASFDKYREDSLVVNVKKQNDHTGCFHVEAKNKAFYPLILKIYKNEEKFLHKTRNEFCKILEEFLS